MVVAPFYGQDVAASLLEQVADVVLTVARMFHKHLLTRDQRPPDAHHQHVLTWGGTREKRVTGTHRIGGSTRGLFLED